MKSKVSIPKIEYFYITNEISFLGYKKINGKFLSPDVYDAMTKEEQKNLKIDIAKFLKELHSLDYSEISKYVIDNKSNMLREYQFLKDTIYDTLTDNEREYIDSFFKTLKSTTIFDDRKCLCHNDFSCNHLLLDDSNGLVGIIDFGDAGIIDEYSDFMYLLEDSEEEIGVEFGEDILKIYGNINTLKAKEYQDVFEQYYPIEMILYGIKNNRQDFIDEGRDEIKQSQ